MPAYLTRMPAGIPGDVSRKRDTTLEPVTIGATAIAHGAPVKIASGVAVPIASGDAASDVYGFLARPYPMQGTVDALGQATSPAGAAGDVMRRGYMTVKLALGTAAKDGQVYVRTTAASGKAVGDIEATADPATSETALSIEGAPTEGNTGNATIGTLTVQEGAKVGAYTAECTAATVFSVYDPDGLLMRADGAFGTAFSAGGVAFTITAGATPCVAGDSFTVTVSAETTSTPAGNVAVPAKFMGEADANGNVEIAYNL